MFEKYGGHRDLHAFQTRRSSDRVRRRPDGGALVALAASDPANLLGTVLPGPKVPRVAGSRVLYRDGLPVATSVAGEIAMLATLDAAGEQAARRALSMDAPLRTLELAA